MTLFPSSDTRVITFTHDQRGLFPWILNVLWVFLGGWHMFLTWFTTGLILCCTCVGIPCGIQTIKISFFLLFPFGKTLKYDTEGEEDEGVACCMESCNCLLNVFWAISVGWILALQAFITGVMFCLTIIGIPFGWQCFKLTYLCFRPFGVNYTAMVTETKYATSTNYRDMV